MFYNASKFNQDIREWDTRIVDDMENMFNDADQMIDENKPRDTYI